jgi:hypothetical protein
MARGWMMPGSTPATFSGTASARATATQAVMSRNSSPASSVSRTALTSSGS